MSVWALIVAAGASTRMGGLQKVFAQIQGIPVVKRSVDAFSGLVQGVVVVGRKEDAPRFASLCGHAKFAQGGDTRQQSVLKGLQALPQEAEYVLVHDAARPFVSREIICRCIDAVKAYGSAVAGIEVTDTIKEVDANGRVVQTTPRAFLRAAQTPQAFRKAELMQAIESLELRGETATDDAAAMEAMGKSVYFVEGSQENRKITTALDLEWARFYASKEVNNMVRVGIGYDVHRLVAERALILCGVSIPYEKGLLGHSDADVALHALMDALLGAAAMGDIGKHFPDTEARYAGADSAKLLAHVLKLLNEKQFFVQQLDMTIVAQKPKLSPWIPQMTENLANLLGLAKENINIKASTSEGLGFEGRGEGISVYTVATVAQASSVSSKDSVDTFRD